MGFIKAAINSVGGTMADQWLDYYMQPTKLTTGAAVYKALPSGTNNGRG